MVSEEIIQYFKQNTKFRIRKKNEDDKYNIFCTKCNTSFQRKHMAIYDRYKKKREFRCSQCISKKNKKHIIEILAKYNFSINDFGDSFVNINNKKVVKIICKICKSIKEIQVKNIMIRYQFSNKIPKCINDKYHYEIKNGSIQEIEKIKNRHKRLKRLRKGKSILESLKIEKTKIIEKFKDKNYNINSSNACKIMSCIPSQEYFKIYLDKFDFVIDPTDLIKKFQTLAHIKNIILNNKTFCTFIIYLSTNSDIGYFNSKCNESIKHLNLCFPVSIRDLFKKFKFKKYERIGELREAIWKKKGATLKGKMRYCLDHSKDNIYEIYCIKSIVEVYLSKFRSESFKKILSFDPNYFFQEYFPLFYKILLETEFHKKMIDQLIKEFLGLILILSSNRKIMFFVNLNTHSEFFIISVERIRNLYYLLDISKEPFKDFIYNKRSITKDKLEYIKEYK
jgi:hypothetical protein